MVTILWDSNNYYCQFTNEETGTDRLNNLPQITQVVSGKLEGEVVAMTDYFIYWSILNSFY